MEHIVMAIEIRYADGEKVFIESTKSLSPDQLEGLLVDAVLVVLKRWNERGERV